MGIPEPRNCKLQWTTAPALHGANENQNLSLLGRRCGWKADRLFNEQRPTWRARLLIVPWAEAIALLAPAN
jgi:hypothetical protein